MTNDVWIKPSGPTFSPSAFVVVTYDERIIPNVSLANRTVSELLSIHCVESHRRHGRWSEPVYRRFMVSDDFYNWIEEFATVRKRLYVLSDSASNFLTLSGFWDRVESRGCKLVKRGSRPGSIPTGTPGGKARKRGKSVGRAVNATRSIDTDPTYYFSGLVLNGNTDIIKYRTLGKSLVWCNFSQYIQSSEEDIAKAIGYQWVVSGASSTDGATTRRAAGERAFLWLRAFQRLADWWQQIDGGPWGFTTGMLSLSFLRKRIPPRTILNHSDDYTKDLENTAIFGGRRSLWYTGNIGTAATWERYPYAPKRNDSLTCIVGRIAHVDIRSMYPHLLATQQFPIRHLSTRTDRTVKDIIEMLPHYGVIARVRVKTKCPEYPHTRNGNTVYPIGEFATTLCGSELATAASNGEIVHIYSVASYALGNPFADAAQLLLKHRMTAIEEKQIVWELFIKHISNAMAGKLAQRKYLWAERPNISARQQWGQWIDVESETGKASTYKAIAGMVFERVDNPSASRPMGASFAYLCSYGRYMMRTLRAHCPEHTIISQDTDGIWARESALEHLPVGLDGSEYLPGDLRVTDYAEAAHFFSPQHYWYNGKWKLSGYSMPTIDTDRMQVQSRERESIVSVGNTAPLRVSTHRTVTKHLGSMPVGGIVGEDCWVTPHYCCWVDPC